ncbi:CinA family protein [Campylobacter sp. MIT 21-1685]|uniref:CinA family protein n=1 Tax=unclassified Campylobacter TaxID=2593542 RepID=UPI00224A8436|nr:MULTISPECIES: CinA family protein [unclassified Campylobacter]MCX2683139.1 CinA family protein [Campylobacter sp. MIT 21-1684]MCX2751401.1 CinA family protein [Campylobacter sp. MIT 21-1682]MCX2807601.1 CinA family protein [Campylobacter sp. MIT 21-1685]
MKHLLFIVGDELVLNENFKQSLYRAYESKFKELNEICIQNKIDKELPFLLERLFEQYDFITLFSAPKAYATIAKIVATLSEDTLVLKEDTLVPDKAFYEKNSFVCKFNQMQINVLKVSPNEKLPILLGEVHLNFEFFCLFGIDEESALLLLETLTKSYEVTLKSVKLLENVTLIKVSSFGYGKVESFLQSVQNLFGQKCFLGKNPIEFIVSKLLERNLKISFAESCTGGLCASELTKISGVSAIFEGSIISYSNRIKHEWLGISESVLENNGEYSERCVYFMLKGIFKTAKPDFALAISGLTQTQETQKLKAGTVYIGAMYRDGTYIQEILQLQGDREFIQKQAVLGAFCLLLKLKPELF